MSFGAEFCLFGAGREGSILRLGWCYHLCAACGFLESVLDGGDGRVDGCNHMVAAFCFLETALESGKLRLVPPSKLVQPYVCSVLFSLAGSRQWQISFGLP